MKIKYNRANKEVNCPNCSAPNDEYSGECVHCGSPIEFTGSFDYE